MTPTQFTAARTAIQDLERALIDAYTKGEITSPDADEFLRMLNALALFLSLKPLPNHEGSK